MSERDDRKQAETREAPTTGRSGHRGRMRQKMTTGANSAREHELVEYLLYGGIPYRDTKEIAYDLLKRFGNVYGVFNATSESLLATKGMTPTAVATLKASAATAEMYEREKNAAKSGRTVDGVLRFLSGLETPFDEACYVLKVAPSGRIAGLEVVHQGATDAMEIPQGEVASAASRAGCQAVIVVHNHPSGSADASKIDVAYTYSLAKILGTMGIRLVDHLIAFDKYAYSMKNKKLYDYERGKGEKE